MATTTYPRLDEGPLKIIVENLKVDPDYLKSSPYSDFVKVIFGKPETMESVDLQEQINNLILELNEFKGRLTSSDVSEYATYLRVKASLLEMMTTMRERMTRIMQYEGFLEQLVDLIEEVCPPDVRTVLMDRIKNHD